MDASADRDAPLIPLAGDTTNYDDRRLLGVKPVATGDEARAREIGAELGLPVLDRQLNPVSLPGGHLLLQVDDGIAMLAMTGRGAPHPVTATFEDRALAERRRAGHNELLGRAVGWKQSHAPSVLDSTGGFGRDAFLLADLGCQVLTCERNAVVALLLAEALERGASGEDSWVRDVVSRIQLQAGDARSVERDVLRRSDVVYLDPMFPADRRAAPAKEMQILHCLLGDARESARETASRLASDADALFSWALSLPVKRIVVKRPRRAPPLAGPAPGHTLQGRAVRFDVYPRSV